jgi:hypothetical protein
LQVVVDRSVKIEHARLFGGGLAGLLGEDEAGAISARRPS